MTSSKPKTHRCEDVVQQPPPPPQHTHKHVCRIYLDMQPTEPLPDAQDLACLQLPDAALLPRFPSHSLKCVRRRRATVRGQNFVNACHRSPEQLARMRSVFPLSTSGRKREHTPCIAADVMHGSRAEADEGDPINASRKRETPHQYTPKSFMHILQFLCCSSPLLLRGVTEGVLPC